MTRASLRGCAAAALLAGLVYINSLHNPFVYDDYRTIIDNGSIVSLTNVREIFWQDASRPIVNFSYAIDRSLWGLDPFGFHFTNVLLHMLNVVLLFVLVSRVVEDTLRNEQEHASTVSAFVAASLFAVHPMMTQAVGWVSGRSELLCATWFLAAVLCARRWMIRGGARWWLFCAGFWLASLLTKELGAMLPLVLLAYDRLVLYGGQAERHHRFLRLHAPILGFAALAAAARVAAFAFLEHPAATDIQWRSVLVELNVAARYLGLMVVPTGQTIFHDVRSLSSVFTLQAWWGAGVVATVMAVAWRLRRTNAPAALGVAWFLLLLIPSSALVVLGHGEAMSEHRVYLASCGLFFTAGSAAAWTMSRIGSVSPRVPWIAAALLGAVLFSLSGRTLLRNAIWASPIALWREAADRAPNSSLPRTVLAESLQIGGRQGEAIDAYREALQLDPLEDSIYLKLGMCLAEAGRFGEATEVFEKLRGVIPDSPFVSTGLGIVTMLSGDTGRAREHFRSTIERHPRDIMARQWLAVLEEEVAANPAEALKWCEELRQIAPGKLSNDECVRRNRARLEAIRAGGR